MPEIAIGLNKKSLDTFVKRDSFLFFEKKLLCQHDHVVFKYFHNTAFYRELVRVVIIFR